MMRTKADLFRVQLKSGAAFGVIVNARAVWVGVHSSFINQRLCVNFVPCLTLWITSPKGTQP